MTSKFLLAAASASFLFAAATGAMAADAPKGPKLTHGIAVALTDVQKANTAKDYPTALTALAKAKAVADPTPYDMLMINRFAMGIHIGMGDLAAADVDAEAAADTDPAQIPDTDKAAVYKPALQLAMNAKRYDKAMKYAKAYMATTPTPTGTDQTLATQALYLGGDLAGSTSIAQKNVDTATAAGQRPARSDLDIILAAQVKQKDEAGAEKTLEALVANYNMPDDWNQIMGVALTTKGMRDIDYIYMGRLMFLQAGKISATDASLVGSTASRLAFYGDAVQAEKLGATGFPPAGPKADADKKTIPAQIAAGAKQNGQYNVKLAQALYGYGMFPEAITAAQLAKTKGGTTDPTEADMVIGMAETAAGRYADAVTAFGSINAANPASARVVRLWSYFAKTKSNPATAAQ